jgi:hypothetical protein
MIVRRVPVAAGEPQPQAAQAAPAEGAAAQPGTLANPLPVRRGPSDGVKVVA